MELTPDEEKLIESKRLKAKKGLWFEISCFIGGIFLLILSFNNVQTILTDDRTIAIIFICMSFLLRLERLEAIKISNILNKLLGDLESNGNKKT